MDEAVVSLCPKCGREPKLVNIGYKEGGAWDGSHLIYYVIRCRPWWGIFGTHLTTKIKGVASRDFWYRWKENLEDEWNSLASEGVSK